MNSKPNSPTSTRPHSPIPMEPNSPTMTPLRSTTPSDLFWQIQTIWKRRMIAPIFDDSILPNHWSTLLKMTLVSHIEDMITIKEILICSTHQGCQVLPTNISSASSRATSPSHRTSQNDREICGSKGDHRQLSEIPITTGARCYRSFDHLRTTNEISERIAQYVCSTGTLITTDDNERLATLWILLKDIHLVSALIRQARIKFNYLCANLIEIFVNISKIEWSQPMPAGGAVEQLGLNIL